MSQYLYYHGYLYRQALVNQQVSAIKQYLTRPEWQKGEELAEVRYDEFGYFLKLNHPDLYAELEDDLEDRDYFPRVAKHISREIWDEFYSWGCSNITEQDEHDPATLLLEFKRIIRDQWLVHFSHHADKIVHEGFQRGVGSVSQLALTTWVEDEDKDSPGYTFAFTPEQVDESPLGQKTQWSYGTEAVLFRASGVEVWHRGDHQTQTIVDGPSAHNFVRIVRTGQLPREQDMTRYFMNEEPGPDQVVSVLSCRGKILVRTKTLTQAIQWVMAHEQQYRGQLFCR